jgi:hypothetical protein
MQIGQGKPNASHAAAAAKAETETLNQTNS